MAASGQREKRHAMIFSIDLSTLDLTNLPKPIRIAIYTLVALKSAAKAAAELGHEVVLQAIDFLESLPSKEAIRQRRHRESRKDRHVSTVTPVTYERDIAENELEKAETSYRPPMVLSPPCLSSNEDNKQTQPLREKFRRFTNLAKLAVPWFVRTVEREAPDVDYETVLPKLDSQIEKSPPDNLGGYVRACLRIQQEMAVSEKEIPRPELKKAEPKKEKAKLQIHRPFESRVMHVERRTKEELEEQEQRMRALAATIGVPYASIATA